MKAALRPHFTMNDTVRLKTGQYMRPAHTHYYPRTTYTYKNGVVASTMDRYFEKK